MYGEIVFFSKNQCLGALLRVGIKKGGIVV